MDISLKQIRQLIKQFTGQDRVITIPRVFIELTGDYASAALLNQILFWSDKTDDPDGWFYKSAKDWNEELCLSTFQVAHAVEKLKHLGVETRVKRVHSAPTKHYRINADLFYPLILQFLENQETRNSRNLDDDFQETAKSDLRETYISDFQETDKSLHTEITTENTFTENTYSGGGEARAKAKAKAGRIAEQVPTPPPPPSESKNKNKGFGGGKQIREQRPVTPVPKPTPQQSVKHWAVDEYCTVMEFVPGEDVQRVLAERVQDPATWKRTLDIWRLNGFNRQGIGDLLDRYEKELRRNELGRGRERQEQRQGRFALGRDGAYSASQSRGSAGHQRQYQQQQPGSGASPFDTGRSDEEIRAAIAAWKFK